MVRRKAEAFEPVTMGHIRGHGCRDLLIYCNSGGCFRMEPRCGPYVAGWSAPNAA